MQAMRPSFIARPLLLAISALAFKLAGTFIIESHSMTYVPRLSMNFIVTLTGVVLSAVAWPTLAKALLVVGIAALTVVGRLRPAPLEVQA